jgi:hypothetical protein
MGESLGPAVKLNDGYEHYWAYVSHFTHSPFYVYAYAFGDLLVRGLMEKRARTPAGFAPLYEDLLAAGGTKTYVEALAPFGLNPREKAFWAAGMRSWNGWWTSSKNSSEASAARRSTNIGHLFAHGRASRAAHSGAGRRANDGGTDGMARGAAACPDDAAGRAGWKEGDRAFGR